MEAQNDPDNEFATRKWYVINDQNNADYGEGNEDSTTIKFETKIIKSNLCDYSDTYILVIGDITAIGGSANTKVAFKNCAPFRKRVTHINDQHVDNADDLDIVMPIYNLNEYSNNYSDTSGSLWQFKRYEQNMNNKNPVNVNTADSSSFKYKSSFIETSTAVGDNIVFKNVKIDVPLKYLSNFWRSLKLPLINCKINLELNWNKDCVMPTNDEATFKITNTKLYLPIVTLSSKDNAKLVKLLEDGFERPAYWNEYQTKIKTKDLDNDNPIRLLFDSSFQGIKRLFVLAFNNTTATIPDNKINNTVNKVERNNHRKYFLPKVIDGRNFYDQLINDMIKQYDGIIKIAIGQGDD